MTTFLPPSLQILGNALDAATLRQRIIANNIANVDTPGYKAQSVEFETLLQKALTASSSSSFVGYRTDPRHIPIGTTGEAPDIRAKVYRDPSTWGTNNGNNVDVEYEMTKMAENQIWYNALVQEVNANLSRLREVIKEGR